MRKAVILLTLVIGIVSLALQTSAQQPLSPGPKNRLEVVSVHGRSLEGNLEGDSPDRHVVVYLPPSYAGAPNRRYPVLYVLHGYGSTSEEWVSRMKLTQSADAAFKAGAKEMIVVVPDGRTLYGGTIYTNSVTTGFWEDFIAEDLVNYIDTHYRTNSNRLGRGLAGHSGGGYGTLRIGAKRPDVFGSLYALSACCLSADIEGIAQDSAAIEPAATPDQLLKNADDASKGKGGRPMRYVPSWSAGWSPNPNQPPFFFDLPTQSGHTQKDAVAKWIANSFAAMVDQYVPNLRKYRAIAFDVGLQDDLISSNRELDLALAARKISHSFETYQGDHNNRIPERFELKVFPYFSRNLQ